MIACKSYKIYEEVPENKEILLYELNLFKTVKIDNYILIGCKSDELYENDKLFILWFLKFINKINEIRKFKVTGWSFLILVKKTLFLKSRAFVCS